MPSAAHVTGCARVGIARLNAFRLNVYEPIVTVLVNGAVPATGAGTGLLIEGATVTQQLNEQTDTAQFRARGWSPLAGQRIGVYVGEQSLPYQMFGGRILETTLRYLAKPDAPNIVTDISCIDPTWLLGRTKVLATYVSTSATTIVLDIVARFTRGVTTVHVQAGLPLLDVITFSNESVPQCLTTICARIGAYWFLDYAGDLHVFTVADQAATPITQAKPGPSSDHALTEDLSQVATRIIGLGGGVGVSVDLLAGATEVPVDLGIGTTPWYPATGGIVQIGGMRVTYGAVKGASGRGALVGTGNSPTTAPLPAPASGSGLSPGTYQWGVTYKTASGETLIGPLGAMVAGGSAPSCSKVATRVGFQTIPGGPGYTLNASYIWRIAVLWSGGGFSLGPPTDGMNIGTKIPELALGPIATDPATGNLYNSWLLSSAPTSIVQVQLYASLANSGAPYYFVLAWSGAPNTSGGWLQAPCSISDADRQTNNLQYPTGPIATFNAANVTIPKSASGSVTGRALYRTAANGAALKKVADIANNTATTYLDTTTDAALGAAPPALDTSALKEDGQIQAGASAVLVTDPQPFLDDGGASGGWALVGNMAVRYTGISGNQLTGVPATGSGSVTATVRYGTQALVQPRLTGVPASGAGALTDTIHKGDLVTLRMETEDQNAALALAQRFGSGDYRDGLIELVVNDSRFGPTELQAQITATLTERKDPKVTVTYATRDPTHEVGRLVTFSLTTPAIAGTFRIQRVTFTEIAIAGAARAVQPKRLIEATNKLFTFADLLRRLSGREGGVP